MLQWLRIHLPMPGTQVQSLIQEDPRAAEHLSPRATAAEARKPWSRPHNERGHGNEKPRPATGQWPPSPLLKNARVQQ